MVLRAHSKYTTKKKKINKETKKWLGSNKNQRNKGAHNIATQCINYVLLLEQNCKENETQKYMYYQGKNVLLC